MLVQYRLQVRKYGQSFSFSKKKKNSVVYCYYCFLLGPGWEKVGMGGGGGVGLVPVLWVHDTCESYR